MRPRAFSLIELLVVTVIIAVLAAILVPALKRARFVARETVCASNDRQMVVAMLRYAADFQGWYPTIPINASIGLNPWGCNPQFLPMLGKYGAGWELWGCPLRPLTSGWSPFRPQYNVPQSVLDTHDDNAIAAAMQYNATLTIGQFLYWVPTKCNNGYEPHNRDPVTGVFDVQATDDWPTRVSQLGKGGHPLISDLLYIYPLEGPSTARDLIRGGHAYDTGRVSAVGGVESINAAYPDGHAEHRTFDDFALRQSQQWYVFY
ncbi:MAG: prepilin-type N-terminal cleavage/methylation domain-containing protein [Planctomycetes bacterium]|nr:prepilin-type N-terminal cleavage/methylation domain-containing protein [Planctomycetota bacterium]